MLLREFRQSRNLTMKEVCDTDLSIAQLSKFERGVSELTINKLRVILDRLNITIEEFFHAEKEFELGAFEQLILDMKEHYINREVDKLLSLRDEQLKKYEEKNVKFFELNAIMLSALIKDLDEDQYEKNEREAKLIDHLMEVDLWCHYEIVLFANSIPLFTIESLVMLTNEMINNTQYYRVIGKHRTITIQTLTNVILVLLEKGETFHSKNFHDILEELLELDQYMLYEKNVSKYLSGFYYYLKSDENRGLQLMEESIHTFDILGRKQLAENFRMHLNNIQTQK